MKNSKIALITQIILLLTGIVGTIVLIFSDEKTIAKLLAFVVCSYLIYIQFQVIRESSVSKYQIK